MPSILSSAAPICISCIFSVYINLMQQLSLCCELCFMSRHKCVGSQLIVCNYFQASKAALVALYETLRVEVGADIHITIATPGFIESEMTKGKHLSGKGQVKVDPSMRDVRFIPCLWLRFFINFVRVSLILCMLVI